MGLANPNPNPNLNVTRDAPALKSFFTQLAKEANQGSYRFSHVFKGLKAPSKKDECLEDLRVCVRAVYAGLGTTTSPEP